MKQVIIAATLLAVCSQAAFAAVPDFPNRPMRIVTPFAPGAGTDIVARAIAKDFTEAFGKQVIVDNRPGGTGTLGAVTVLNALPDGHNLFLGTSGVMVTSPLTSKKISYDPLKDFAAIGRATILPPILVSHPSLPAKTFKDVLALAKAKPGQLNFASSGQGSPHHLGLELLKSMTGIDVVHVPYKGGGARAGRYHCRAGAAFIQQYSLGDPACESGETENDCCGKRQALRGDARSDHDCRKWFAGV